jgi:hypothetical protein
MALQADVEINDSGVVANYLRVTDINYNRDNDFLSVLIEAYVSAETRNAGKKPIHVFQANLDNASSFTLTGDTLLDAVYNKLKEMPEFEGAIDV